MPVAGTRDSTLLLIALNSLYCAHVPLRSTHSLTSLLSLSLVIFLSVYFATFCVVLFCVICVFCRLVVLVRLSVPVQEIDWKDDRLQNDH